MRTSTAARFLFSILILTITARGAGEAATVWDFYEEHPRVQDFYPWGLYDIPVSRAADGMNRESLQYGIDVMAENGFTASWGHGFSHRFLDPVAGEDDILFVRPRYNSPMPKNPVLSELGRWAYGEMYPGREMKSLYSVQHWFRYNWPLFAESESEPPTGPFMTEPELQALEARTRGVLDFITELGNTYPDTIMGLVTDDEPHLGPGSKAAVDVLERNTGMFATTILPSWAGFKQWAPHMQPIGGDWYVTLNMFRDSWVIAERLRWLNENHPDKAFIFMPLLTRYSAHDTTLPGLKDALTSQVELRLQIWQAVALGCKGVYGWSTGGGVEWAGAGASPINALMQPTNGLWPELKDLGLTIVPIGPVLLPCQADTSLSAEVACGSVRYPEFTGPAIDYGLLRDTRPEHDRWFLIPWNNDLDAQQSATLTLPAELLGGRQVYELETLKKIRLADAGRLQVTLPPGGGRIYAIVSPAEFAACKDTILRHRVRYPRVVANMRREHTANLHRINLTPADELLATARAAEEAGRWEDAATAYRQATGAIATAAGRVRSFPETEAALHRLATILTETDELLRTHIDLFELTGTAPHWHLYANKHAGPQMRDWFTLARAHYQASRELAAGKLGDFDLGDRVLSLVDWATTNRQQVEAVLAERLQEVRRPVKVAYVTADRDEVEYYNLYTRLYKNTLADWYAPDDDGQLTCFHTYADWINPGDQNPHPDIGGNTLVPADYDVVFIQQIRYAQPPAAGEPVDPALVLMPSLVDGPARAEIAAFVEDGGGLLLAGIAGLYANVLGIEPTLPDKVRENRFYPRSFGLGLAPSAVAAGHPIFAGLPAEGIFTNGNFPGQNLVTECAFEGSRPAGMVVANERDDVFGRIDAYAAIVEYSVGAGKVLVFGGKACDFTPGNAFSLPAGNQPNDLMARLVDLTVNAVHYLAADERFEPAAGAADAVGGAAADRLALPLDGWLFHTDPEDRGTAEGWYKPAFDAADWKPIRVDSPWGPQGYAEYVGPGWYRLPITVANKPGHRTLLHFAGVDEEAIVYVDGERAGDHLEGPAGWNEPFAIDITRFLGDEPATHLLAVRAENSAAAGGIWRPVYITYEQ